jgi:quinol monooxygenase YgiN
MRYGRLTRFVTHPGRRDDLAALLLRAPEGLKASGCELYVVLLAADKPETLWVNEVWNSRESHAASLSLPGVREAIAEAMPMLTGEIESLEMSVPGGLGLAAN